MSPFVVHHVGARNGRRGFPVIPRVEKDIISVMYEAESDGNAQILRVGMANGTREVITVNACLGEHGKLHNFYLNFDPYTSSILSRNEKLDSFYQDNKNYDYVFKDALKPILTRSLTTEGLDQVVGRLDLPSCDFLSLDTQGSELEILMSGPNVLQTSVGVLTEVEFEPLYENQPLFGEVNKFLSNQGFRFIRFEDVGEWAPRVLPLHSRGQKMQLTANALYLRSPENLTDEAIDRLIFAALSFGQTEFAKFCANHKKIPTKNLGLATWQQIIQRFEKLVSNIDALPKTFSDIYSAETSFNRFRSYLPRKSAEKPLSRRSKLIRARLKNPFLFLNYSYDSLIKSKYEKPSELENLFADMELHETAKLLRINRLHRSGFDVYVAMRNTK